MRRSRKSLRSSPVERAGSPDRRCIRAWDPHNVARPPPGSITSTSERASLALHTQQDPIVSAMVLRAIARSSVIGQLFGLVLVAGVVVWRLGSATLKSDVETLCHCEERSGSTLRDDWAGLTQWTIAHLRTPEGNRLLSAMRDESVGERARRLKQEALVAGVRPCPLVDSLDAMAADAAYRHDVQRLCSTLTFPALADQDPAARLEALEDWVVAQAKSPRTRSITEALRLADPSERPAVLRRASGAAGIFTCDIARVLDVDVDAH
jgi:hypothetical protein